MYLKKNYLSINILCKSNIFQMNKDYAINKDYNQQ